MTRMSMSGSSGSSSATATTSEQDDSVSAKLNEIFQSPYNRQALIIGVGLVLFQQLSGQPSVLYFANRIFEKVRRFSCRVDEQQYLCLRIQL